MPSGESLTASEMVRGVLELTADLEFGRVSLGFPGLIGHGKPAREPGNLDNGWVDFDYSQAFGRPGAALMMLRCRRWEITIVAVFSFLVSAPVLVPRLSSTTSLFP